MRFLFVLIPGLVAWLFAFFVFHRIGGIPSEPAAWLSLFPATLLLWVGVHATTAHPERGEFITKQPAEAT